MILLLYGAFVMITTDGAPSLLLLVGGVVEMLVEAALALDLIPPQDEPENGKG